MSDQVRSPRVSVALCTYNGAQFVRHQIESILREGADELLEIVVADDGSTDGTIDIVRDTFAEHGKTHLLRLLEGGGHGVTANFERAVIAARGELVALSDQDDAWLPGRLAAQVSALDAAPHAQLVFGDARLIDADGRPLEATLFERLEVARADQDLVRSGDAFRVLLRRNIVTGATVVFRRDLLDRALPFPRSWVHDEWLAMIAAAQGGVLLLDRPVTEYRQHDRNEIGVRRPTLQHKIRRILQPRGDRNRALAERSALLAERLDELQVEPRMRELAQRKARFERSRAELPLNRLKRVGPVVRLVLTREYSTLASQGAPDIVRDLVQPAGTR